MMHRIFDPKSKRYPLLEVKRCDVGSGIRLCAMFSLMVIFGSCVNAGQRIFGAQALGAESKRTAVEIQALISQEQTAVKLDQKVKRASAQYLDESGLTVEKLIDLAHQKRADLLAAQARVGAARARSLQAGLRPNPTLDIEYGTPRFLGGEAELDFAVGVSQLFELGGKRRLRREAARLEAERAEAEFRALERQIAADVRVSYARAVAAGRFLDTVDQLVALNEELERATAERVKRGDAAQVDLSLVRVELDRLRVERARALADLESEMIALRAAVGLDPTDSLRIVPLVERPPRLELSLPELTAIALRERADLQAARLAERASVARLKLVEARRTPDLAGTARFSRSRQIVDLPERIGGIALDKDNELTFGIQIELPIFNRNQGEIAAAANEQIQATREREALEAKIKRDVALAYRQYQAAAESLALFSTRVIPQTETVLASVRAAYGLGEFSVFDLLQEQRRLIESETAYSQTLRDYYSALAELERATGAPLPREAFAARATSSAPRLDLKSIERLTASDPRWDDRDPGQR